MIIVRETQSGIEPLSGNPTLTSLDGQVRAPLRTILASSWTSEDRAKFGVYLAEPFVTPDGKELRGNRRFEGNAKTGIREVYDIANIPTNDVSTARLSPSPARDVFAELDALRADVAALKGEQA